MSIFEGVDDRVHIMIEIEVVLIYDAVYFLEASKDINVDVKFWCRGFYRDVLLHM